MPTIPGRYEYLTEKQFYEEIFEITHMLHNLSRYLYASAEGNKLSGKKARVISTKLEKRLKSFRRNSTKYLPYGKQTMEINNHLDD